MHDAPRVEAYEATDAFEDGRGNRPLVEGTVARGWLNDDEQLTTGKVDGQLVDEFPFPVTREVLERGPAAVQRVLHAVPRQDRDGQRHDRAARLKAAAVVSRRPGCAPRP